MPPALRRNKFATDARNASWHPAPASSVWDLRRLRAYAASESMLLFAVCAAANAHVSHMASMIGGLFALPAKHSCAPTLSGLHTG